MDLVSSCREKLAYFRIKELKDVLTQLGVSKQGKKQELVDRILGFLLDEPATKLHGWAKKSIGKERVAKVIDETYRTIQVPGPTDLASKCESNSVNNLKPKKELDNSYQLDMKVHCPCGNLLLTESMIKCVDPQCQVWQHIGCVIIPEKPGEGAPPEVPPCFYCEMCRINRADPFWLTITHPLLPVKMASSGIAADGTNTIQTLEKTFPLTRADIEMLQGTEFDLQVWCILLNDKVPCRMQWPLYAELLVNGYPIRLVNRPGQQLLGINGRDDGSVITTYIREGINKICLSRCDARVFCFGIRIAKRRTVQEVLNMVPGEADGEHFGDAVARVRRCFGCGASTENADSDSDIEVVADSVTVNLRCPMSGSRIKIAGRFKPCAHMGCFDLETFVELNQKSRKWQCPICLKNYSLENIIIDPYFNRITSLLRDCGDVNEIDVKPDGSWRVKNGGEYGDLAKWHLPDGSLSVAADAEVKLGLDIMNVKQESFSEGNSTLKLGIKRNRNGTWEVSKAEDFKPPPPGNHVEEKFQNHFQNIIPMSSSATGSYRDGEDPSVNEEGWGRFDFSMNNGHEVDSLSLNFDPTFTVEDKIPSKPQKDADIIVLSDSDDDDIAMISPRNAYGAGPPEDNDVIYPGNRPLTSGAYSEDPVLGTSGASCLDLFNNENDDFEMPLWPPETCPGFQLFDTDADVSNSVADVQQQSLDGPPFNGYGLASVGGLGNTSQAYDLSISHSNAEEDGRLVDNPVALGSDDPSLQIFLPSQSIPVPVEKELSECTKMPDGVHSDDWISLRLGDAGQHDSELASTNGLNWRQPIASQENGMEALADAASLLRRTSDNRVDKASSSDRRSIGPFSPPRRPRSVRQRLYLSIDTDSD